LTAKTLTNPAARLLALYTPRPMVPDGTAWNRMV
jgi:hypothetical protein